MTFSIIAKDALHLLLNPQETAKLDDYHWQDFIRFLRFNDLMGTMASQLARFDVKINSRFAEKHLNAALIYSSRQAQQVINEAGGLKHLLNDYGIEPIFLKGSAYILCEDFNANGRVMSDVDILVDKKQIPEVERVLKENGWKEKALNSYDENYYRQWSHELPPFRHLTTGTTLDIHHTLIPPITGIILPVDNILNEVESAKYDTLSLQLEWRLLHCIIHFFFNEGYEKPLRDIWDIKCLFLKLEGQKELEQFFRLAHDLGLRKEVLYAVHSVVYCFGSVSSSLIDSAQKADFKFTLSEQLFFNTVIKNILLLRHSNVDSMLTKLAAFIMMSRGHIKKMPLKILLPHIATKAYRSVVKLILGRYHFD